MSKSVYGKVLKVELDATIKKQDGGTYKGYRLTYENDDGEIQKLEKANASLTFGAGPVVKTALKELAPGDDFSLFLEKNDKGYLDVVGLVKGRDENAVAEAAIKATPRTSGSVGSTGGKVVSTYETPEERKLKQRLIVRQSSLGLAIDFAKTYHPSDTTEEDIQLMAESFENWVYRGL